MRKTSRNISSFLFLKKLKLCIKSIFLHSFHSWRKDWKSTNIENRYFYFVELFVYVKRNSYRSGCLVGLAQKQYFWNCSKSYWNIFKYFITVGKYKLYVIDKYSLYMINGIFFIQWLRSKVAVIVQPLIFNIQIYCCNIFTFIAHYEL